MQDEKTKEELAAEKKAEKAAAKEAKAAEKKAAKKDTVSHTPESHPHLYKNGVKISRKASWPKGWWPSGNKIADTKAILDAAPKVSFMIPLGAGEAAGAEEIVQLNGYKYTMLKGHMVTIPKPVADMLANKYRVEMEVVQRSQAHATAEKSEALS